MHRGDNIKKSLLNGNGPHGWVPKYLQPPQISTQKLTLSLKEILFT